jgi:hypothetical protein
MIDEHNHVFSSGSKGEAYKSSQAAERSLNAAILRAEISKSYEEFLDIFETFYADDFEVSREGLREMIRGKDKVRPFLLNLLVPLHVMAEVAGLSVSVQQTAIPGDTANETHSAWRIDFTGVSGKRCTLKWYAIRRWNASRVVYEHHYDLQQIGGPLTDEDLNLSSSPVGGWFRFALLRPCDCLESRAFRKPNPF